MELGINFTFILEGSGFVYGFLSLTERVFTGGMIMLIQILAPGVSTKYNTLSEYFRWVLVFGCGGSAICALIVTLILCTMTLGKRLKNL